MLQFTEKRKHMLYYIMRLIHQMKKHVFVQNKRYMVLYIIQSIHITVVQVPHDVSDSF